jgi:outer membrane protein assembly factor BamB
VDEMNKTKRYISVMLTGSLILGIVSTLSAQDWPQWRGINRDGKVEGFKAPDEWPAALTKKWSITVGPADATPALAGKKLFVFTRIGSDEVIQCLDADTGKVLWLDRYAAATVTGPAAQHPGPRSSPTVAHGKVVTLGVGGVLSCLDAETGKILWRNEEYTNAVPDFFTSMSPIVIDGMCISHLGGKDKGTLLALDLVTGKVIWKLDCDGPAYGSPVLMTVGGIKQVVFLSEKNMFGVGAADGRLLWQTPAPNEKLFFSCATPVIEGDKIYYTGQGYGTRAIKIEQEGDRFTVKALWNNDKLDTTFNTPVLKDHLLYGITKLGFIVCINTRNGETVWVDNNRLDRFGSIIDTGGELMALSLKSELLVFKHDTKEYTELVKYKVAETPTRAHPVVSGNRIIIKESEMLSMWEIK